MYPINPIPPESKVPQGCVDEWRTQADSDGYLDWEGFSKGLAKALRADATRLSDVQASSLKLSGRGFSLARPVEAKEIEAFLCQCEGNVLVQALARTKKEVYRCHKSLQQLERDKEAASTSG